MVQVGYSWLERASNVTSGSVISNSVGSLFVEGSKATMLFSAGSLYVLFAIAGIDVVLGDVSISTSLEDSYLMRAIFRVYTIFQDFKQRRIRYG